MMQLLDEILKLAETMQRERMLAKMKELIPSYQTEENAVVVVGQGQVAV